MVKNFRNFLFFTKFYSGDKLEEVDMGEACGTYAGKKCVQGVGGDTCRRETALKN
jgi:hypothetical protein